MTIYRERRDGEKCRDGPFFGPSRLLGKQSIIMGQPSHISGLLGPQKWFTYQNFWNPICKTIGNYNRTSSYETRPLIIKVNECLVSSCY